MARKKKLNKNLMEFMTWLIGVLVALLVGGAFASGSALNYPILKLFPLIVHQILGWTVIISTLIGVVMKIAKSLK